MQAFLQAGKMDRDIVIEAVTRTFDAAGAPVETWSTVLSCRAELVQSTAKEFIRDFGSDHVSSTIFRIRWTDQITLENRVTYNGTHYDIIELAELGRRRGLEIRCKAHS